MRTKGFSMRFEINKIIIKESVFFSQFEMRKLALCVCVEKNSVRLFSFVRASSEILLVGEYL